MSEKLTPEKQKKENRKALWGLLKVVIGASIFIYALYWMFK